jgi:4-oxalocrotonate tautomerase
MPVKAGKRRRDRALVSSRVAVCPGPWPEAGTAGQKRGLMKDITDAVVKNFSVPAEAVVVTLVETEKQAKMKGGVLFSEIAPR